jgi:hypothetical protein
MDKKTLKRALIGGGIAAFLVVAYFVGDADLKKKKAEARELAAKKAKKHATQLTLARESSQKYAWVSFLENRQVMFVLIAHIPDFKLKGAKRTKGRLISFKLAVVVLGGAPRPFTPKKGSFELRTPRGKHPPKLFGVESGKQRALKSPAVPPGRRVDVILLFKVRRRTKVRDCTLCYVANEQEACISAGTASPTKERALEQIEEVRQAMKKKSH